MSALVLDGSAALAWCFEDEWTDQAEALLVRIRDEGALVPQIWHLEVTNVVVQAERRKRIKPDHVAAFFRVVRELPISIDDETSIRALDPIFAIARSEGLTTYDASYLELALRRMLPLATLDKPLAQAARRRGVPLAL